MARLQRTKSFSSMLSAFVGRGWRCPSCRRSRRKRQPKNDGLRLEYIFAAGTLAVRCTSAEIDRDERKGEKPSDHAPVVAVFGDECRPRPAQR